MNRKKLGAMVAAGMMVVAVAATPARAQCVTCVGCYVCMPSTGTAGCYCYFDHGCCHNSMPICICNETKAPGLVAQDLALADGREIQAVPTSAFVWHARQCSTGDYVFVVRRADGALDVGLTATEEDEPATSLQPGS